MFCRRRVWMRLLAVAGGTVLACVIAEIGLRWAEVGYPHLYAPDYYCGARLRPSTSGVFIDEGHGHIAINALGFRGPEIAKTKRANSTRIAVLGDSFIEALQVDWDQSFCALLQDRLRSMNIVPSRDVEVVNCGVSGYGTAQELLMLRHYVLPLSPDAVLLAVYPENDLPSNLRELDSDPARPYFTVQEEGKLLLDESFRNSTPWLTASSWYERNKAALVNRSYVLQLLKHAKQNAFGRVRNQGPPNVEKDLLAAVTESPYVYSPSTDHEPQRAWEITERLIQEMAEDCRARRIPFFVFTVSAPIQVYPDIAMRSRLAARCDLDDFFYSERRIEMFCAQSGIAFLPLASRLQAEVDETGIFLHGFANGQIGYGHWNQAGHLAAARIVAAWLQPHPWFRRPSPGPERPTSPSSGRGDD